MNLIFPVFCLHCQVETKKLLCEGCKQHLTLASPRQGWWAGAFEYIGPARAMLDEFRSGQLPLLAPALAGYMALQMDRLKWPLPELIVPVPERWTWIFGRTYSPAKLLAGELGKIWNVPVENLLRRRMGGFSQSKLSRLERQKLPSHTYQWRKKKEIKGKIVLLVDDLAVTGATLRVCMRRLKEGNPSYILGMTVCGPPVE